MIGRIVGGVLGSAIGRQKGGHPIAGAVIGAGTLFAARRLFPQRYAALAATAAAAYLTKKWADRAEARKAAEEIGAQGFPGLDATVGAQITQVGLVVKQKTTLERWPLQDRDEGQQQQQRPAGRCRSKKNPRRGVCWRGKFVGRKMGLEPTATWATTRCSTY